MVIFFFTDNSADYGGLCFYSFLGIHQFGIVSEYILLLHQQELLG